MLTLIEVPASAGRTHDSGHDRIVFASTLFDGDVARAVVDAVLTTYYDLRHEALANGTDYPDVITYLDHALAPGGFTRPEIFVTEGTLT